ncbi:eIF-2-alpha kinase GCN2-like [Rosa rugosa]|uniref:eIF-2-alpha kinase GCN2-like n=1 Tax=Rosa rugosa TaxID=74645 RepID=UPI002B40964C|nr:eIF-2-alpha kinase GCN2-like [Rosa rugosa]
MSNDMISFSLVILKQLPSFFLSHFTEHRLLVSFQASGGCATAVHCTNNFDEHNYAIKKISIGEVFVDDPNSQTSYQPCMSDKAFFVLVQSWTESKYCGLVDEGRDMGLVEINNSCLYIQLELCDRALKTKLVLGEDCKENWMTREDCGKTFRDVVHGLEYIHGKSIMHGDISTANILYRDGVAKITDFGLGKEDDKDDLATYSAYHTPERMNDDARAKPDCKADIFSLGIILFEMLQPFTTYVKDLIAKFHFEYEIFNCFEYLKM